MTDEREAFNNILEIVTREEGRLIIESENKSDGIAVVSKKDLKFLELIEEIFDIDTFLKMVANENGLVTSDAVQIAMDAFAISQKSKE